MKPAALVLALLAGPVRLCAALPPPPPPSPPALARRAKKPFDVAVSWRLRHGVWQATDDFLRRETGISRYRFVVIDAILFKYRLEYTTSVDYHYYFYDAEGDRYSSNAFWSGDHFLVYNSNDPNIVQIVGS